MIRLNSEYLFGMNEKAWMNPADDGAGIFSEATKL